MSADSAPRAVLVYNPNATTTTPELVDTITGELSAELKLDVETTKRRDHAGYLAAGAVHEGYDVVVALGGDGTLNEVLQGVAGTPVRLMVLPGGSTNVFARIVGLPNDAVAATRHALACLREGRERTVSVGTANGRFFAFCAGWGYDAEVVRMVDARARMKRTVRQVTFVWSGLLAKVAGRAAAAEISVTAGDQPPAAGLVSLVCCNGDPYTYLGPLPSRLCPLADLDKALDVTALRSARTVDLLRLARTALTSDHVPRLPFVRVWHDIGRYHATSSAPLPLHVDGEYMGEVDELTLRSVPRALTVVA